jgi:transposase-like protein
MKRDLSSEGQQRASRSKTGPSPKEGATLMNGWSMKKDRALMQLARANLSIDQIATRLKTSSASVLKATKRAIGNLPQVQCA